MENLNKENFFDEMSALYPEGMKKFHAWMDAYKTSINWNKLFNSGLWHHSGESTIVDQGYVYSVAPKFHDLPFELQFGILVKFLHENNGGYECAINVMRKNLASTLKQIDYV